MCSTFRLGREEAIHRLVVGTVCRESKMNVGPHRIDSVNTRAAIELLLQNLQYCFQQLLQLLLRPNHDYDNCSIQHTT